MEKVGALGRFKGESVGKGVSAGGAMVIALVEIGFGRDLDGRSTLQGDEPIQALIGGASTRPLDVAALMGDSKRGSD